MQDPERQQSRLVLDDRREDVETEGLADQVHHRELPDAWDAATSYHRIRHRLTPTQCVVVRERAIRAILDRARSLLRHASRPTQQVEDAFPAEGELDLAATLEQVRPWQPHDIKVQRTQAREADVVAILDMSLSMTGPKIALTAVAIAILRLRLDAIAVVHFDTTAHTLVQLGHAVSPRELVKRVLEVPAQGYTNIEAGLSEGLSQLRRGRNPKRVAILMSDGIANMGADPARLAASFPHLHVVRVGTEEKLGVRSCRRMAAAGHGRVYPAPRYADLPAVVRQLVRELFSG